MTIQNNRLINRRDGLLREAEYLQKRLEKVHGEITEINSRIMPYFNEPTTADLYTCPKCARPLPAGMTCLFCNP